MVLIMKAPGVIEISLGLESCDRVGVPEDNPGEAIREGPVLKGS